MVDLLQVKSLQHRIAVITTCVAIVTLILGVGGARMAEDAAQKKHLDLHLEEVAQTVLGFTENEVQRADSVKPQQHSMPRVYLPNEANSDLIFQVWLKDGNLLLHTNDTESQRPLLPLTLRGFETGLVKGKEGRIFCLAAKDGAIIIQVAEQFEDIDRDTPTMLRFYFLPIALPLLLLMFATWALLRRASKAIDELVHQLRHIDINEMGLVEVDNDAHEVVPLVAEVNNLVQKANSAIMTEQRFTAMAAHELRTPMAGIKAQAQMARKARNQEDLHEALGYMISGIDRASHVFDQLFDLSRLDSTGKNVAAKFLPVRISNIYEQVMHDLAGKAGEKRISRHTRFDVPTIDGLEFAWFLLLRNLLANAIQYSDPGGHIEVSTQRQGENSILYVDDAGRGIPKEARESAFERFNRLDQHGPDGVGLGLSIVQKCVELQGGRIELQDSPLGGLRVSLKFPDVRFVGSTSQYGK